MLLHRLLHAVRNPVCVRLLRRLRRTQYWSRDQLREYQFAKLKRLLEHAYQHVPFYGKMFNSIGACPNDIRDFDDFGRLPILTKAVFRENESLLLSKDACAKDLIPNATGGSTGEPMRCYQDRNYHAWADAARIRGWYEMAGRQLGDRTAVVWGAAQDLRQDFTYPSRLKSLLATNEVQLNAFNLSDDRMRRFVQMCKYFRPQILRGYFTAIRELANYIERTGQMIPGVCAIVLCAETVDLATQSKIERIFKAPSFNAYGGREVSLMAMECPAKTGLHEISENNYVELEPIELSSHSAVGNIVVTNLNNYIMPFIRYQIGDIGIRSNRDSCPCGRGSPLIQQVIGRTTEVFEFEDGTKIAGEMFIHLMKDFPITEYQFIQTSTHSIVLKLKAADCVDAGLRQSIAEKYRQYLPTGVTLSFEEVGAFAKTLTGKFRFVFREMTSSLTNCG